MGGCVGFVCWLGGDPWLFREGLVCIVVCGVVSGFFGVFPGVCISVKRVWLVSLCGGCVSW